MICLLYRSAACWRLLGFWRSLLGTLDFTPAGWWPLCLTPALPECTRSSADSTWSTCSWSEPDGSPSLFFFYLSMNTFLTPLCVSAGSVFQIHLEQFPACSSGALCVGHPQSDATGRGGGGHCGADASWKHTHTHRHGTHSARRRSRVFTPGSSHACKTSDHIHALKMWVRSTTETNSLFESASYPHPCHTKPRPPFCII